jgi:sulfocyanin
MKRIAPLGMALLLGLAACGGSESADNAPAMEESAAAEQPAEQEAMSGEMTQPDWFQADGQNVTLEIVAGKTNKGNYWNFNGYQHGEVTITVPVGANVTIHFHNNDPNMAHSLGIVNGFSTPPASIEPTPVFDGAITADPTSMTDATLPGEDETVTFTAATAGQYAMVCFIPGHAVSGMWLHFNVSADGEAGVTGAM